MSQARVRAHAFGEYRRGPRTCPRPSAVARRVLLVGRDEGEENIRVVVQIKNNLAAFGHPKAFALSEDGFQWLGDYEITADEVVGGIAPKTYKTEQGISKRTLENAKKELGIRVKRINNTWYWNCVLEDCKVAKIIDIARLRYWERAGKRR